MLVSWSYSFVFGFFFFIQVVDVWDFWTVYELGACHRTLIKELKVYRNLFLFQCGNGCHEIASDHHSACFLNLFLLVVFCAFAGAYSSGRTPTRLSRFSFLFFLSFLFFVLSSTFFFPLLSYFLICSEGLFSPLFFLSFSISSVGGTSKTRRCTVE